MTEEGHRLLTQALALPERERAELARELIASLDGLPDPDVDEAWAAEIQRRLELDEQDPNRGDDWATVKSRIEMRLWPENRER